MNKKIIAIIALALLLCACGKKNDTTNHIVNKEPDAATALTTDVTVAPTSGISPTLAPAATAAPDAEEKASDKLTSGGSANATVTENGKTRQVDLKFEMTNNTGIDFTAMLLEPVTADLTKGGNRFPADFVFKNGQTIDITPPTAANGDGYVLDTTLFNIAAIDANGTGYVFQNIDLASSKSIVLTFENGVPKAIVN